MKKRSVWLLAVLLTMLAALMLAACGGDSNSTPPDPGNGTIERPYALTVGISHAEQVVAVGSVYHKFTTGPTSTYMISLNNDSSLVGVTVYSDATFSTTEIISCPSITFVQSCFVTGLTPATTYYVRTDEASSLDETYDIVVAGDIVSTGMTYTSTDVPKSIPDNDLVTGATSTVTVTGGATSIAKVSVTLNITHTYDNDLDIYLVSPEGTRIMLSTDNGGALDNYIDTVFDDFAASSITAGVAPFTGIYRPESVLTSLIGQNANGTWTLHIYDDLGADLGTLNSWSITIH
jgi:subtilisin-like proprotein convertase family protein